MKIPNARILEISGNRVLVELPAGIVDGFKAFAKNLREGWFAFECKKPFRPRTTGPRSQENKFRGGCRDISEQLDVPFEDVCEAIRRMAVEEGYPVKYTIDGKEAPISTARASREDEALLIRVMHRFADENNLYLTEYDDEGKAFQTVGGRSREEMRDL